MSELELCDALEALLFAAISPMKKSALRAAAKRWLSEEEGEADGGEATDANGEVALAAGESEAAAAAPIAPSGVEGAMARGSECAALQIGAASSGSDACATRDGVDASSVPGLGPAEAASSKVAADAAAKAEAAFDPSGAVGPCAHARRVGQEAGGAQGPGARQADPLAAPAATAPFCLQAPAAEAFTGPAGARFERSFSRLCDRWAARSGGGFRLAEVAEGYAFRSHPRFGPLLRREREGRPSKLSKPALEALAIVAYRQPATKPEVDELRGVDSGGGLRVLIERQLIAVVGKKDEPGRPLLYGTTPHFLDFFALNKLSELPSLREFEELHEENVDRVGGLSEGELLALSRAAPRLSPMDAGASEALAAAMAELSAVHGVAREAFGAHGIALEGGEGDAEPVAGGAQSEGPPARASAAGSQAPTVH